MHYSFDDNEFTSWNLLEYMRLRYGTLVNGALFTMNQIHTWVRHKRISKAYGGHRLETTWYKELENLCVLKVEGLSRSDVEAQYGSLSEFKETLGKHRANEKQHGSTKPRKQRTALYYQILGKRNTTKKTLSGSILPDNHKQMGIQLKRKKKKEL